jgi:hypothetical protein
MTARLHMPSCQSDRVIHQNRCFIEYRRS